MKIRRAILPLVALIICALPVLAQQEERILSYDSDIRLNADGSMRVSESIRVFAGGDKIKHGIYRDFPTEYKDKLGIRKHVPFELVSVTRDGHEEDYHTSSRSNGVRVYIGPRFSSVPVGEHTYVVTYLHRPADGFLQGSRRVVLERHRQRLGLSDRTCIGNGSPCRSIFHGD